MLGTSLLWRSTVAFTYLKLNPSSAFVYFRWSWSCYFGLGLKNLSCLHHWLVPIWVIGGDRRGIRPVCSCAPVKSPSLINTSKACSKGIRLSADVKFGRRRLSKCTILLSLLPFRHWSIGSSTTLCWKPLHMLVHLPDNLRDSTVGPDQFQRELKTHLFTCLLNTSSTVR